MQATKSIADTRRDMQNCFRQYPEIYGSEIDNDDDDDDDSMTADAAADVSTPSSETPQPTLSGEDKAAAAPAKEPKSKSKSVAPAPSGPHSADKVAENRRELGLVPENYRPEEKAVKEQDPVSESESLVPKAAHDGR
jgi:mitochondrial intermembrane space import and assembly protein 40